MPKQTLRLNEVRAPTVQNDQIPGPTIKAEVNSVPTYQEYNNLIISRLRNVLGSDSWLNDAPPAETTPNGAQVRYIANSQLLGVKNGINITFTTEHLFVAGTQTVFYNGVALTPGLDFDYTITESAGPGTGYDTVILRAYIDKAPRALDRLTASYQRPI